MTENQLNKMFTNGPINMHLLFTMLGSSACKGTILYSLSPIITFWLNKQKWEGCSFLIMLMLSFLMHLSTTVHREMFSFCIAGGGITPRFSEVRVLKEGRSFHPLCEMQGTSQICLSPASFLKGALNWLFIREVLRVFGRFHGSRFCPDYWCVCG